uniref:Uncharacterized protein n=1 Tax=Arundo donax TaxID=35708 RepID=A0A0A9FQC6_ARUDO
MDVKKSMAVSMELDRSVRRCRGSPG